VQGVRKRSGLDIGLNLPENLERLPREAELVIFRIVQELKPLSYTAQLGFFRGTLAPFLRASESPMAMACFLLVTRPPLPPFPERKVPFFSRCNAFLTDRLAAFPYLAISASK
jgi:hypothetical protein